jgi:release factor glutamine methyltransferase
VTATAPGPAAAIAAGTNIAAALRQSGLPPTEARILLAHALQLSQVQLITQAERCVDGREARALTALFERRRAGQPIAYLLGQREFFGLMLNVTPAVLIPRADTELLVELALAQMASRRAGQPLRILDLGTGSGAVAIAIACHHTMAMPPITICALDASSAALAVARANAARHRAAIEFVHSDWYQQLGRRQFDLIVANPPYIVAGDHHLREGDLRFEPQDALTDHGDGLGAIRRIVAGAGTHLAAGGALLLEHGYDQAAPVRALLAAAGLQQIQSWRDLAGIERVSGGQLPAPT